MSDWYPQVKKTPDDFLASLLQILPKNLGHQLAEYVKEKGGSFESIYVWKPFLDKLTDEEHTTLYKATKQLESSKPPIEFGGRTFTDLDGVPITNGLSFDVCVMQAGRDYAKKKMEAGDLNELIKNE